MKDTFIELTALASVLNEESNAYTQSLVSLQAKINKLNLGIEAWVTLSEGEKTGEPGRDTTIRTLFGYARTSDGWGFATKRVRIERGFFEGDHQCPWENHYDEEAPKLLLKSSRELRIQAAEHIESLLEALKDRAEEVLPTLEKAQQLAKEL